MSYKTLVARVARLLGLVIVAALGPGVVACSGSSSTPPPPPAPPSSSGGMFITDFATNSISGYGQGANCNCAPSVFIQGGNTGLAGPAGIAIDKSGNMYVANENVGTLTKYPGGASGNIKPSFAIGGLNSPIGVAVDSSNNLYVSNSASLGVGAMSVQVFAPGATVAKRTISGAATGLSTPGYMALDASNHIWVANQTSNSVEEFANSANGNVAPLAIVAGGNTLLNDPQGIAFDSSGRLYVAVDNALGVPDAVLVFSPPVAGNIAPSNILCGPNTGVNNPTGIAVNAQGTLFVVNSEFSGTPGYLTAFLANNIGGGSSCAGPLPNGVISGPNTPFIDPTGIALL